MSEPRLSNVPLAFLFVCRAVFQRRPGSIEETAMPTLDRITQRPGIMGGKPCIRGMRVAVGMIVGQIGAGRGIDEILLDYTLPGT